MNRHREFISEGKNGEVQFNIDGHEKVPYTE